MPLLSSSEFEAVFSLLLFVLLGDPFSPVLSSCVFSSRESGSEDLSQWGFSLIRSSDLLSLKFCSCALNDLLSDDVVSGSLSNLGLLCSSPVSALLLSEGHLLILSCEPILSERVLFS